MFNKIKALVFQDKPEDQEYGFIVPVSGEIIDLGHVPDEAFSQRMMGTDLLYSLRMEKSSRRLMESLRQWFPASMLFPLKAIPGLNF